MRLKPGTLIVLEGLDATGKTTQADLLAQQFPYDLVIHSPSGGSAFGKRVYELTEQMSAINPLSRQLLHLASHAEMYDRLIIPALGTSGVFMDRNWWSTVAYGWSDPELREYLTYEQLVHLAQLPTRGCEVAQTFVFLQPWKVDPHNTAELADEYRRLCLDHRRMVMTFPDFNAADERPDTVHRGIVWRLEQLMLLEIGYPDRPTVEDHSHYYADPTLWDSTKVLESCQTTADRTGASVLIHPHPHALSHGAPVTGCKGMLHLRCLPGKTEPEAVQL